MWDYSLQPGKPGVLGAPLWPNGCNSRRAESIRMKHPSRRLFRELNEEVGLAPEHVHIMGRTKDWLRYDIPAQFSRPARNSNFRGQKQIWFLLRFLGSAEHVRLNACDRPEFDCWRWVEYWSTLDQIVEFKARRLRAGPART